MQNIPKASKTACRNLLFICSLFDSVERRVQRGREKRTKIYNFQFESCLARVVFRRCLKGCVGEGLVNAFGNPKNGKMLDKRSFSSRIWSWNIKIPSTKSTVTLFERPEIASFKAGPRCLAGEFGHGLSSLPEPQGQNQGALGWKSRRRLGIPRSSGMWEDPENGWDFLWFFSKGQIMHVTYHCITISHCDDAAPIPPVLLQLWTTIWNPWFPLQWLLQQN